MADLDPKTIEKARALGIELCPWYCIRLGRSIQMYHSKSGAALEIKDRDVDAVLEFVAELIAYYEDSSHDSKKSEPAKQPPTLLQIEALCIQAKRIGCELRIFSARRDGIIKTVDDIAELEYRRTKQCYTTVNMLEKTHHKGYNVHSFSVKELDALERHIDYDKRIYVERYGG